MQNERRQLKIECRVLARIFLWKNKVKTKMVYFYRQDKWVMFLLSRYNQLFVELTRSIPESDRYFYQEVVNQFKRVSIWCVRNNQREEFIQKILKTGIILEELILENVDG